MFNIRVGLIVFVILIVFSIIAEFALYIIKKDKERYDEKI